MGLGNFFKKLFGGQQENANEPEPIEPAQDPVKDASDYVVPTPEIMPETTEAHPENDSAFAGDGNDDFDDLKRADRDSDNRIEEAAD